MGNATTQPSDAPAVALERLVDAICVHIAVILDRSSDYLRSPHGLALFEPHARKFVVDNAPAVLRHLLPTMRAGSCGLLETALIPNPQGAPMRLIASEDFRIWRLEDARSGGIEVAGSSAVLLLDFVANTLANGTPWLQIVGLSALLALEELATPPADGGM